MWSALRFTELTKRFFAIRLISFLALTDACASVFNIMGGFVDVSSLRSARPPLLCQVQAAGLLYFNLSSIMWTSCFAFTLYRDVAPRRSGAGRRDLRKYEGYFHLLCWPVRCTEPHLLNPLLAACVPLVQWCALWEADLNPNPNPHKP